MKGRRPVAVSGDMVQGLEHIQVRVSINDTYVFSPT